VLNGTPIIAAIRLVMRNLRQEAAKQSSQITSLAHVGKK
jgi:hypothetical protein